MPISEWLLLKRCDVDASKKIFVSTGIVSFDFELFIGARIQIYRYFGSAQ